MHTHTHPYTHIYTYTHMCTTCSECVTDVYVGVKTPLCNVHTRPCTSAQNTCSSACNTHCRPCTYAPMHIRVHMHAHEHGCVRAPKTPPDKPRRRHQDPPSAHTCAHACACIRVHMCAYTGARAYACSQVVQSDRITCFRGNPIPWIPWNPRGRVASFVYVCSHKVRKDGM